MTREPRTAQEPGRWEHPASNVCDGTCRPCSDTRELHHHSPPVTATLARYQDTVSGQAFRDDTISAAGIQAQGEVGWRLQVNSEIVETDLEDMEQVLSEQLTRIRAAITALSRMPQPRTA